MTRDHNYKLQSFAKLLLAPCLLIIFGAFVLMPFQEAIAHCDGLDGPVVKAAKGALDTGDINAVLIWIPKQSEPEVNELFKKTLAIRKLGNEDARAMADMHFFETVVRVHRAAEGASYTGLKPAGRDLGPAIPAADKALEQGSLKDVSKLLTDTAQKGLEGHFAAVTSKKNFKKDDVEAGREYVEAYVSYIHYVEHLYDAARSSTNGHYQEPDTE